MQVFLKKIVLKVFLLCFIIVFIKVTLMFSGNLFLEKRPDYFFEKSQISMIDFSKSFSSYNPDILVLGNSKALSSISSYEVEKITGRKCANLSVKASNFEVNYFTLIKHLENNKAPSELYFEISFFSFDKNRLSSKYQTDSFLFSNLFDGYNISLKWNDLKKLFDINKEIGNFLRMTFFNHSFDYYGDRNLNCSEVQLKKFNKNKYLQTFPKGLALVDNNQLDYLKRIKKLCEENNIRITFYSAPESEEYYMSQTNPNEAIDIINKLFPKNDYLDFRPKGKYFDYNNYNLLSDSHHIACTNRFTRRFVQEVDN